MNKNNILMLVTSVFVAVLTSFIVFQLLMPKQAFVRNQNLFNEFEGNKELRMKLDGLQQKHRQVLDSVNISIQLMQANATVNSNTLQQKQRLYFQLQQEFNQEEAQVSEEYTKQIWNQINTYTKEYGKKNGYSLIFGATGSGGIMYATSANDITDEVLNYINNKYEGN